MEFNLGDAVTFHGELGEVESVLTDETNNELISIDVVFNKQITNFGGRLTILKDKINDDIFLYKKYIGGFPRNANIFYLSQLNDENLFTLPK